MRLAAFHGVLLLVALIVAYHSWTSENVSALAPGAVVLWDADADDIRAVTFESEDTDVRIERRQDERGRYFWGHVVRVLETYQTPPADSAGSAAPIRVVTQDTAEFLVGQEGDTWMQQAARLTAVRDLGVPDDEQREQYELDDPVATLTIELGGVRRTLLIGGGVFGTGDRYALNPDNGRVYVLSGSFVLTISDGDRSLMDRRFHDFQSRDVASVVIRTPGGERRLQRVEKQTGPVEWAVEGSEEADQTYTNFMNRVAGNWIVEYKPEVPLETLTSVVRIEYFTGAGRQMGWLDVLRGPPNEEGVTPYYVHTELSRVPARIYESAGEQIAADAEQLF